MAATDETMSTESSQKAQYNEEETSEIKLKQHSDLQVEDITEKISIAYKVLKICRRNKILDITRSRVHTGKQVQFIKELTGDIHFAWQITLKKTNKKSFQEYLSLTCLEQESLDSNECIHDRIRILIRALYLVTYNPICKKTLQEELKLNKLAKMIKLEMKNKALLIENPEITYSRIMYLKTIMNYRKFNDVNFIYISYMEDKMTVAISPRNDVIFTSDNEADKTKKIIKLRHLVTLLPKKSVVILDSRDTQEIRPLPNQYSTKNEMKSWLTEYDIAFDEQAHTAELYALIQKFKHMHKKKSEVGNILEQNGFTVKGLPNQMTNLNFYQPVANDLGQCPYTTVAAIRSVLGNVSALEDALISNEAIVLAEDLQLENIIESIRKADLARSKGAKDRYIAKLLDTSPLLEFDPYLAPPYIIT